MRDFIRNLSAPAEFCLIMLIALGIPLLGSAATIVRHFTNTPAGPAHFNNLMLLCLFLGEALVMWAVYVVGRIRGWSFKSFGLQISWKWTGLGLLLYLAGNIAYLIVFNLVGMVTGDVKIPELIVGQMILPLIILNALTNPIFEEFLETGYVIRVFQGRGIFLAILASAGLRGSLHAYLGVSGAAGVFAIGIVFALVYWKWRQLWPLFVAHSIMDLVALVALSHRAAQQAVAT